MNKMDNEKQLKELKALAGKFFEEVKSNNVTDLLIWIDTKLEHYNILEEEMRKRC